MTFLLKDIADHLGGSQNIVDAVENRIFPDVIPQEVRDSGGSRMTLYPCLVLQAVSATPEYYLGGEASYHQAVIQVDVFTDGRRGTKHANELAELVRNRLSGYRGQFGTGCRGTARLVRCNAVPVEPADGSDTHIRRTSMDFEINHTAATPSLT